MNKFYKISLDLGDIYTGEYFGIKDGPKVFVNIKVKFGMRSTTK